MLAQMGKIVAEFFAFVDFDLYYTESGSPHGGFLRVRLICQKQLEGVGLIETQWSLYGNSKHIPAKTNSKYHAILHDMNLCNTATLWNKYPAE